MNINEQKMNRFLCYFGEILEWLTKGRLLGRIKSFNDKATIALNVWVTTFGPPCTIREVLEIVELVRWVRFTAPTPTSTYIKTFYQIYHYRVRGASLRTF